MGNDRDKSPLPSGAALRRQAEERLRADKPELKPPGTEEETQRLLHELEVHQIQLEMQNAELSRSREEAEAALEMYTELYDFAPVGFFTLGRNGAVSAVNLRGATLLGVDRSQLIGRKFGPFVAVPDRSAFTAFLDTAFTGRGREVLEVALLSKGDFPFNVRIEAVAAASGQECRLALIDISDRIRSEAALQAKEEGHWSLINNLPIGVVVHAPDTRVLRSNIEASQLLGMSPEQIMGKVGRPRGGTLSGRTALRCRQKNFPLIR